MIDKLHKEIVRNFRELNKETGSVKLIFIPNILEHDLECLQEHLPLKSTHIKYKNEIGFINGFRIISTCKLYDSIYVYKGEGLNE